MTETRFVSCARCHGEGRLYSGHPNDPNPRDEGPCPSCDGTCEEEIEVEPIELEDLEQEREEDRLGRGGWDWRP